MKPGASAENVLTIKKIRDIFVAHENTNFQYPWYDLCRLRVAY